MLPFYLETLLNIQKLPMFNTYANMAVVARNIRGLKKIIDAHCIRPVSYTHLDVYKRQDLENVGK